MKHNVSFFLWNKIVISGLAMLPVLVLSTYLISCEYDHLNTTVNKELACDTLHVSYLKSVKPIFINNCYSCHSTAVTSATNGFDMEDFTSLKDYLTIPYSNDGIYGSKFSHAINQQGYLLYMPPTYKLSPCELAIIGKWIKQGAPND
jgi:hypothetical protein